MMSKSLTSPAAKLCCLLLAFGSLLGTTGCKSASANATDLLPNIRLDPPAPGMNKVWVEFQDESGQNAAFEDTVFENTQDALDARGYEIVDLPNQADYVLWATLHCLEKIEDDEQVDQLLARLGPIAGASTGLDAEGMDGSGTTVVDGTIGSGMGAFFTTLFTRKKGYMMVCDAQISRRRVAESAAQVDESSSSAETVRALFEIAKEQRILVFAAGSGLEPNAALEILTPKMIEQLKGQFPRSRAN